MSPEPRLKAGEQTDVPSGSLSELFFKDWGWCSLISFNKKQLWAFLPCWGHSWKRRFLGSIWQPVFQASSSQMLPDVWQFHAWFWVRQTTFSGFFFIFCVSSSLLPHPPVPVSPLRLENKTEHKEEKKLGFLFSISLLFLSNDTWGAGVCLSSLQGARFLLRGEPRGNAAATKVQHNPSALGTLQRQNPLSKELCLSEFTHLA